MLRINKKKTPLLHPVIYQFYKSDQLVSLSSHQNNNKKILILSCILFRCYIYDFAYLIAQPAGLH